MKEFLIVLFTSLVVGIGSSWLTNTIALSKLEERSMYVDKQIAVLQGVVDSIQTMQIELSRRGEWMSWVTNEIIELNDKTKERYTTTDAEKDFKIVNQRIERLEEIIK